MTSSWEIKRCFEPGWRRLLTIGWAMFVVSFVLPVATGGPWGLVKVRGLLAAVGSFGNPENIIEPISGLTNVLILLTGLKAGGERPPRGRWITWLVAGAAVLNLYWVAALFGSWDGLRDVGFWYWGVGYWVWVASFACVAGALVLRYRETPIRNTPIASDPV